MAAIVLIVYESLPPQVTPDPLLEQLHSPDRGTRKLAFMAIRQQRHVPPAYVPPLLESLQDPDPKLRMAAAEALGELGRDGQLHLPRLAEIYLAEKDRRVQATIRQTMDRISNAQQ